MKTNRKTRTRHADGKAKGGDQACLMNILFHEVAEKRGAHAEEEDCERERPTERVRTSYAVRQLDRVLDRAREIRPAIHRADTAMQQERRDCRARPFIREFCHKIPSFYDFCFRWSSYNLAYYRPLK